MRTQADAIAQLKARLAWFERQVFGSKAERLEGLPIFDRDRVPVERIELVREQIRSRRPDQYEMIGHKSTYRLAQRPGSYVVLEYVRPVIKREELGAGRRAARQPNGRELSRQAPGRQVPVALTALPRTPAPWRGGCHGQPAVLTQLTQAAIGLLAPVYEAQLTSIRMSHVIAMDETPIKAWRSGHGKMKMTYFWLLYGDPPRGVFPIPAESQPRARRDAARRPAAGGNGAVRGRVRRVRAICEGREGHACAVLGSCAARTVRGRGGRSHWSGRSVRATRAARVDSDPNGSRHMTRRLRILSLGERCEGYSARALCRALEAREDTEVLKQGEDLRSGGPDGIVTDGEDGFLVPLDDAKAIADRLHRLLTDGELNRRMGLRARATVEQRFSENVTAQAFLDTYADLLSRRTSVASLNKDP